MCWLSLVINRQSIEVLALVHFACDIFALDVVNELFVHASSADDSRVKYVVGNLLVVLSTAILITRL